MSDGYADSVLQMINRGKVTEGVICQLDGSILAASPKCKLSQKEVKGLLSSFIGPVSMFKMYIGGTLYKCQRFLQNTVFGRMESEGKVFTAILTSEVMLIGFAKEKAPGSCIHELQLLEKDLFYGDEVAFPTEQLIQPALSTQDMVQPNKKVLI